MKEVSFWCRSTRSFASGHFAEVGVRGSTVAFEVEAEYPQRTSRCLVKPVVTRQALFMIQGLGTRRVLRKVRVSSGMSFRSAC